MLSSPTHARSLLDTWREQGADRVDPLRFHFIEALERRATRLEGEPRRILDMRLSELLDAYAGGLENTPAEADGPTEETTGDVAARGALGALIDDLASHAAARDKRLASTDRSLGLTYFPELPALEDFRNLWATLRTDRQLRQSLKPAPENAGPLNSGILVHRSLKMMRELSPGYLRQFLSYVDTLAWLEQLPAGSPMVNKDAPPASSAKKRSRGARTNAAIEEALPSSS